MLRIVPWRCFFALILCLVSVTIKAQSGDRIFRQDARTASRIKVIADGREQSIPWCGGANNPQFAVADLDRDGKKDMVLYEQEYGVRTFLNSGSAGNPVYKYAPEYQQYFPQVSNYMQMRDYDHDNVPDLFHYGPTGVGVCRGFYNSSNILNFFPVEELRYTIGSAPTTFSIDVNTSDIPGIEDVDNDGDLDIVAFYVWGAYLYYYKNMQVEEGLPAEKIKLKLADQCWGKIFQGGDRTHQLAFSCANTGLKPGLEHGNKTTHGNNTVCLLDYDADGDYDYMGGNMSYADAQLLTNGKADLSYKADSMIAQDTLWQSGGTRLTMRNYPLATWIDVDGDDDKDILFSPHTRGTENYRCIAFYENTGTATSPAYTYRSDTFLIDQMIDVGTGAYPVLYDYNKDGKQDLFVGTEGYYQPNGSFRSRISYYENTSTRTDLSFTLKTKDFLNIHALSITGAIPAIGDIDHDGKDDLIIGKLDGTLIYYHNTASTAGDVPNWQLQSGNLKDETGKDINAGGFAAPFVYDIDKDGKKDLLIGGRSGSLIYYRNTNSTVGQASFQHQTDTLGGVKAAPPFSAYGYSVPFIGKIDDTGKEYLLLGSQSGTLYRYDGFQNGNTSTSYTRLDTAYSEINVPNGYTAPAVADLDGDGKYEMFVGNVLGGVYFYSQLFNTGIPHAAQLPYQGLQLYPNPAADVLFIKKNSSLPVTSLKIYNAMGQEVKMTFTTVTDVIHVDVSLLPQGVYLCAFASGGQTFTSRFIKQ